uniref:Uncharacterized protein n=1 Tax=Anguilla anguilla TaxID=7936 RepID=A0A0E9XAF8_ANGAN
MTTITVRRYRQQTDICTHYRPTNWNTSFFLVQTGIRYLSYTYIFFLHSNICKNKTIFKGFLMLLGHPYWSPATLQWFQLHGGWGRGYCVMPITPQANRAPALPVFRLSSLPPLPRSSAFSWITMVRPMIDWGPVSVSILSLMSILATPSSPAVTLPKSPTCLTSSLGPPWVLLCGLKWGPALMQPFVLSPYTWTWKPCSPGVRPVICPVTCTGAESLPCSKNTVPVTSPVPLRTQTAFSAIFCSFNFNSRYR